MSQGINLYMERIKSKDDAERFAAFSELLVITEQKVTWFNEYKDQILEKLDDANSYQRSIGTMLLCNLAKSITDQKILDNIMDKLVLMKDDEKFITQRQYLQNIWKVAIAGKKYEKIIVNQLSAEYCDCISKKHSNLLRLDIISSLVKIADKTESLELRKKIMELIDLENNEKDRKKYLKATNSQ